MTSSPHPQSSLDSPRRGADEVEGPISHPGPSKLRPPKPKMKRYRVTAYDIGGEAIVTGTMWSWSLVHALRSTEKFLGSAQSRAVRAEVAVVEGDNGE